MKNLLATVFVVVLAVPAMAQENSGAIPLVYECRAGENVEIEKGFCELLLQSILRTHKMRRAEPGDSWHIKMLVLPKRQPAPSDAFAHSITMGFSLQGMQEHQFLAYQRLDVMSARHALDEKVLEATSSRCIQGISEWLGELVDHPPKVAITTPPPKSSI